MAVVKMEAKTYQVEYRCDDCGEANMEATNVVKTSMPPWYVHRCPKCGVEKDLRERYPHMAFSLVEAAHG